MYERAEIVGRSTVRSIANVKVNAHSHNIYSGNCLNPITIPSGWFVPGLAHNNYSLVPITRPQVGLDFNKVRCRTCPKCIDAAKHYWFLRALDEYEASMYSAFGTLTFGEQFFDRKWREERSTAIENYSWATEEAKLEYAEISGVNGPVPEFDERGRQDELKYVLRELTLCLKRMRKAGWSLRYMAVTEFGTEKGRSHIHFLFHMPQGSEPFADFRKALKENWEHYPDCSCKKNDQGYYVENCRVGWADVRPVRSNHRAYYACKYIGKQRRDGAFERHRLRASQRYGAGVMLNNLSKKEDFPEISLPMGACVTTGSGAALRTAT